MILFVIGRMCKVCDVSWLFVSAGIRLAGFPSTWRMNSSFLETESMRTIWRESHKTTTYRKR